MKELNRQVVIFGDFSSVGFNIYTQLDDIIKKYNFIADGAPDFFRVQAENDIQANRGQFIVQGGAQQFRPLLRTADRKSSVFIGTNRIHVEQNDMDSESYSRFLDVAHEVLTAIVSQNMSITINRLALNGKLVQEDPTRIRETYVKTFKPSVLYGTESDEFSYRINTKEVVDSLRNHINKIISFSCANQVNIGETKPVLFIEYDYNTQISSGIKYSLDDLETITDLAKNFRQLIFS